MLCLWSHSCGTVVVSRSGRGSQTSQLTPVCVVFFPLPQAAIGFLCLETQADGHKCISRRTRRVCCWARALIHLVFSLVLTHTLLPHDNHQLQNTYNGTGVTALQATLNKHFGYAHAGGMQDTVGGAATGGAATAAGSGSSASAAPSMPPSVPAYASATPSYA